MRDDDDLAPALEDYFRSGAAREDREAMMNSYSLEQWLREEPTEDYVDSVLSLDPFYGQERCYVCEEPLANVPNKGEGGHICWYLSASDRPTNEEEWSNEDDRFITPAIDLDAHNERILDVAYGPKETR